MGSVTLMVGNLCLECTPSSEAVDSRWMQLPVPMQLLIA